MSKIGIIGAMEIEIKSLVEKLENKRMRVVAGVEYNEGTLAGHEVVIARSGVGKVNAAICTQNMITLFGAEVIINTGIAGSLNAAIDIGDIVLSTDVVHHDVDAAVFGYAKGQIPQMKQFSFKADDSLRDAAQRICCAVNPDIHVFQGRICSGDQFISDQKTKDIIAETFGGMAVEMEAASIGQAAFLNGVPFLIVRAISDKADGSAEMDYDTFEAAAAEHSMRLTLGLLQHL